MARYTIGISPGKLTGIAIYDSEENNLMTYVDFEDTEIAEKFVMNRLDELKREYVRYVIFPYNNSSVKSWREFFRDEHVMGELFDGSYQIKTPSDIFAETGIRLSNQPLANAVTMAMEKMKV